MGASPDESVPGQYETWGDVKAAYRFFNNPKVTPETIQQTHRQQVRAACAAYPIVLAIQDGSELDYTAHPSVEGLGFVGGGIGRGLLQHSTLAVTTDGHLLGVLHQIWWKRTPTAEEETRRQRQARACESGLWARSIRAVGTIAPTVRLIHVTDRGGDNYETLHGAIQAGSGFLIRAVHNRFVNDAGEQLWPFMARQSIAGIREIHLAAQPAAGGRPAQPARIARLGIRYAAVEVPPPRNDPRFTQRLSIWAVYLVEQDPPAGVKSVEWMLLISEPVERLDQAQACVDWYTYRWVIEEWHKVEKTGCRLEASQLKNAAALERLAALTAVVAVRLLQVRDLAQISIQPATVPETADLAAATAANLDVTSEQPSTLQAAVPRPWILVVSHLAKWAPDQLTPRIFWRTIARRGGFLGRKHDGQPGWQTIWKGWSKVRSLVDGFEIHSALLDGESCG